ncbi:MAG: hypothetical protein OIF32_10085, partial [Campylobacterales bacterium]|nr:hypothetical protein [Campylobacterales bacterium]
MGKLSLVTAAAIFAGSTSLMASWFSWENEGGKTKSETVKEKKSDVQEVTMPRETSKTTVKDHRRTTSSDYNLKRELVQKENPIGIYVDKHLRVFVPQEELYVYLSLSNNPDGKKVYLPNKESVKNKDPRPVKLGKPGVHTIAHPWNSSFPKADGNLDKNDPSRFMNVTWDNIPPSLKLFDEITGKEVIDSGSIQYFKEGTKFKIVSSDNYSGVKSVYVSVDNQPHVVLENGDEIANLSEGRHSISFYTVDNVGNVSDRIKKDFIVDGSTPKSYVQIHTTSKDKNGVLIAGPDSAVSMSSGDNISKLEGIYYKISRQSYLKYHKAVPLRVLKDGKYTVSYYGKDNVGNKEPVQTLDFYMDNQPPKTTLSLNGDVYQGA